jgi:hypothetical protein
MQLESLSAELRARPGWEAIDLGFRFVRQWWRPLLRASAIGYLPICIGLGLLLWDQPVWTLVLWFWLKPIQSRFALAVLARSLFGAKPTFLELLADAPATLTRDLLRGLTIGRLGPLRVVRLPVRQLEGLTGAHAAHRGRVLTQRGTGAVVGLALICGLFEQALILSALTALIKLHGIVILEVFAGDRFVSLFQSEWSMRVWQFSTLPVLAWSETLFAAGGFSTYLNRRILLEGWDIELGFRRLAQRVG